MKYMTLPDPNGPTPGPCFVFIHQIPPDKYIASTVNLKEAAPVLDVRDVSVMSPCQWDLLHP